MPSRVDNPFSFFTDSNGSPLESGYIFIGVQNLNPETNPVVVYWDKDLTIPAAQPIRTVGGYPARAGTPAIIYLGNDDFSITIRDKNRAIISTVLSATALSNLQQDLADYSDPDKGAAMIGYRSDVPNAVGQTVRNKLDQLQVTPYTFGAIGDGLTNDTLAVTRALSAGYSFFDGLFACDPFEITGVKLDVSFAPGAKLIFNHQSSNSATFTNCNGSIRGMEIDDTAETVPGIFSTVVVNACQDLQIHHLIINGGKDLPVVIYQSDNCHIIDAIGNGSDANRPFAWEIISSKSSTFTRCRLYKCQFGFTLIGPGYKSGTVFPSTRSWQDTLGMKAVDCYVEDHTGHAFDINGAVGAGFSGCVAKSYTGVVGNASFQAKQSTNIPSEQADDAWVNWMDNCLAEDCINGFGMQEGTDVLLTNLQVIRAKRYPVTFNSTKRVILNGLVARDWGLDLANWPLQNGDLICAGVAIWNGSSDCIVDNAIFSLTDNTNTNIGTLALVNIVGNNATIGTCKYVREPAVTGTLSRAIRISGSNAQILEGFRPGDPSLYTNHPVDDTTTTTMYPIEIGGSISLATNAITILGNLPQRGMTVCKVAALTTTAPTGTPQYSVGRNGSAAQFIATRNVLASGIEVLTPLVATLSPNQALAVQISSAGTGQVSVSVRGLHLL